MVEPSFAPKFLASKDYEEWVLAELRKGRVGSSWTEQQDNAWRWSMEHRWSFTEAGGFLLQVRVFAGTDFYENPHDPTQDREERVTEERVRKEVRRSRKETGPSFKDLLAETLREGALRALEAKDHALARSFALRLQGPASPDRQTPLEVLARCVEAGELEASRPLAEKILDGVTLAGEHVYRLPLWNRREPVGEERQRITARTERQLAALEALYPERADLRLYRAAALEVLGEKREALALYREARARGKYRELYPTGVYYPEHVTKPLAALQKRWSAARDKK